MDENNKALMDLMAGIGLDYSHLENEKRQDNLQSAPVFLNQNNQAYLTPQSGPYAY